MSSIKMILLIGILAMMTACSAFEPFVDRRRNAGATDIAHLYVGRSTPQKPVICSNPIWDSKQKVQELADQECQKHQTGVRAKQTDVDYFSCRLLLPTRTYFECEE